jgi:DNA invertase Pin-like site-specific DNA recombinase
MKQVDGASLTEQERAITEYAKKNNLNITEWFRETKTAAKRGRPHFDKMLNQLKKGKAKGAIIHKIDRSARNLHDWAAIGDLIDNNIEVHFAHESLDMTERGGRLSADIQAVMASDYVRNLRQEAIKGLYGRLKQGLYPWRAPIGYEDNGRGKVKTPHLTKAKLVKEMFELYTFEDHSILTLVDEMKKRGLANHKEQPLCKNSISTILNNPFYAGVMKVKGVTFEGKHEPLITMRLFKQTKLKISGHRRTGCIPLHKYLFRGIIRCQNCKTLMPGEKQKGMVYYRCQKKKCATTSVREDHIEERLRGSLKQISLEKRELSLLKEALEHIEENNQFDAEKELLGIELNIAKLRVKEERLLDAFFENMIDKEGYDTRKKEIHYKLKDYVNQKEDINSGKVLQIEKVSELLELCKSPINMYDSATFEEKQSIAKIIYSNFEVNQKKIVFIPLSPYLEIANRDILVKCEHYRDVTRTLGQKFIYTDKNTSSIIPKPLKGKQILQFAQLLSTTISPQ